MKRNISKIGKLSIFYDGSQDVYFAEIAVELGPPVMECSWRLPLP